MVLQFLHQDWFTLCHLAFPFSLTSRLRTKGSRSKNITLKFLPSYLCHQPWPGKDSRTMYLISIKKKKKKVLSVLFDSWLHISNNPHILIKTSDIWYHLNGFSVVLFSKKYLVISSLIRPSLSIFLFSYLAIS